MAETQQIYYDWSAIQNGEIDMKVFANSIMHFSEIVEEFSFLATSNRDSVSIKVVWLEPWSFKAVIAVAQNLGEKLAGFFSGEPVTALINWAQLLGRVKQAINFRKLFGKANPAELQYTHENKKVKVSRGSLSMVYENEVISFVKERKNQELIEWFVSPIKKEGIDCMYLWLPDDKEEVSKADVASISTYYDQEQQLSDKEYEKVLNPIRVSFNRDNKQRFSDGANEFYMTLEDEDFMKKLDAGEVSFSKTDKLIVMVREVQSDVNGQLKTEYIITKVLQHITQRQARLL